MLKTLLEYYEKCNYEKPSLKLDLSHDSIFGWDLRIEHGNSGTIIFDGDYQNLSFLCCQGIVALREWARKYEELENIDIE